MDTMNKTKHSPLPWRLIETNSDYADPSADSHFLIEADNEMGIALTIHDCVPHERGNAELIVTAVNERERLREALHAAVHVVRSYQHGNSAPDLADDFVSRAAALLNETMPNQPETTNTHTKEETR